MDAYFNGVNNTAPSSSATNYGPWEGGDGIWQTSDAAVSQPIPHNLTISKLNVRVSTAPSVGKSWTFTLMVNGVASALTCVISDAAVSASDTAHSVSINQGDTVSIRCVPSGTPTATGTISWYSTQTAAGQFAILAGSNSGLTTARFFAPQGAQVSSATETQMQAPCPIAGTVKNLYCKVDAAAGGAGANAWVVTFRKALANQTLTVTLTDPAVTGNDTAHTVAVAAGDLLTIGIAITGTPASGRVQASYTFVPTTDGDACWMRANANNLSTSATNYDVINGGPGTTYSTTEAPRQQMVGPATLRAFYLRVTAGPGTGGKQYTATIRLNGAGTALTKILNGAGAGSFNITGQSVATVGGDLLAIESVPAATPFSTLLGSGIYYTAVTALPQKVRAERDGVGDYTTQASGTPTTPSVNETTLDNTTYAQSQLSPVAYDYQEWKLNAVNDPVTSAGYQLSVDMGKDAPGAGDRLDIRVIIYQYANGNGARFAVTTRDFPDVNAETLQVITLTGAEADSIVDHGDLWVAVGTLKV